MGVAETPGIPCALFFRGRVPQPLGRDCAAGMQAFVPSSLRAKRSNPGFARYSGLLFDMLIRKVTRTSRVAPSTRPTTQLSLQKAVRSRPIGRVVAAQHVSPAGIADLGAHAVIQRQDNVVVDPPEVA